MKVSIITPSFNSIRTIGLTIDSVLSQTYSNIEYIVIDGGSDDGTFDLLKDRVSEIDYLVSEKDSGIYDAINKGINISTGDIIGILNSDDCFFDQNAILTIVDAFQNNEDVSCVYGNLIFIDNNKKIRRVWKSNQYTQGLFDKSWTPAHPTFYCRRHVYDEIGCYKINYVIAADVDFMYRALEVRKFKSIYINQNIVKMLIGGVSNSGIKSVFIIIKEIKRSYYENGKKLNIPKYLFYKILKIKEYLIF
jgi:glycosyltransferase involved in cell wall biosynthesis